jgi:tetratricopeptide (TPR) repeat protein
MTTSPRLALNPLLLAAFAALWAASGAATRADDPAPAQAAPAGEAPAPAGETPPATEEPAAPPRPTFPLLEEMPLPEPDHFLKGEVSTQRDWIVLSDNKVISCLPLVPRPNTLAQRRAAYEAKRDEISKLPPDKREKLQKEAAALLGLDITIPELEPEPEYRLLAERIARIIHHEDQWLMRIDRVIADKNVDLALELLGRLEQVRPDWPGIAQRTDDLIFADANLRLAAGDREGALMLYEEVNRRRPGYPGLAEKAIAAVDSQLSAALAAGDYRQARIFLARLQQLAPGTPVFSKYTATMAERASAFLQQAKTAQTDGKLPEAVSLTEQALRTWPETPGLPAAMKAINDRYQRVRVAVTRLPGNPTAYPFDTAEAERHRRLTEIPLFEVSAFDGGAARYRTRFFDEWMPFNLGRTMKFTLRQTRQPWETQPVLLGWPITDRLTERLTPGHPRFDERFAGYVDSMTVDSPFEFTISFRRVPPRLEALLTETIVAAPPTGETPEARPGVTPLPPGAFQEAEHTDREAAYRRYYPEPEKQRVYHVAEVVETLYPHSEAALAAFLSGEADVYPNPPAWITRRLLNDPELSQQFFIQKHAVPNTHVIQFNPATPVLKSRELRRALQYSVNRQQLLDDVMLREPQGKQGRVVPGPFPSNSRANIGGLEARPYDPYAGLALALAARNALTTAKTIETDLPTLRMLVPPDPVIQAAAQKIVDGWNRIGIAVEIIPDDDLTAWSEGRWDLIYRSVQMTEPIVQLWPFLTLQPTARIDDLSSLPDWLKQEVIALDRAADYSRAEDRVRVLSRHLSLEAALIPLWELDQYTLYRKNLRGFAVQPIHCYDNIDEWVREAVTPSAGSVAVAP